MSQSSTATMQTPNPMKKKVIVALVSVLVGHMGVLFAISHMKVSELKKIDKEPIKVRFVQIKEDAPPPPPPSEPVKPKVQPKPEPKVVEPPPVVKPKIIAEKPKPNIEKPKVVVEQKDNRIEQERIEQQRREQQRLEQQQREQQQREQAERQRQAEQAERDRLAREQASKPRSLSAGQISWSRSPKPSYTNSDLKGSDRTIVVSIEADTNGSITNVRVVRSTGIDALDQKIVRAVRGAKFRPYKENGVAYPFKAEQPFELKLNSNG